MSGRRILLLGGMLLIFLGLAYGVLAETFFMENIHQLRPYQLLLMVEQAARGGFDNARAHAETWERVQEVKEQHARIYLHLLLAGAIALILTFVTGVLDLKANLKKLLASLFVLGGLGLPAGELLMLTGHGWSGRLVALGSAVWMLLGFGGFLLAAVIMALAGPEQG